MTALVAGCLLGLAGSTHCAVMCGPLALAIGRRAGSVRGRVAGPLVYHAGRVLAYLILAVPAGLAGQSLWFAGGGRVLAVVSGVLLVGMAVGAPVPSVARRMVGLWSGVLARLSRVAGRTGIDHPLGGRLCAGAVNGLLPCGLVYPAALTAAALGSMSGALAFMVGFGLGTMPVLLALSWSAASLPRPWRAHLRSLAPAALALAGVLLIARGLVPNGHAGAAHHSLRD